MFVAASLDSHPLHFSRYLSSQSFALTLTPLASSSHRPEGNVHLLDALQSFLSTLSRASQELGSGAQRTAL